MEFKFLKKNIKKLYYTEFLHCHPEHKRGIFSRKATLSQRFLTSFGMTRELNLLKMTKRLHYYLKIDFHVFAAGFELL